MIDWYAEQSDKFIGTAAAIASAIAAGAAGTASVIGAVKQAGAATDAAKLQTDAANHAADVQGKSTADALAFQRQQAENAYQNAQATQKANYEQSRARFNAIAGVGAQYGLSGLSMPDYVPGVDPHFDTGAMPVPASDGTLGATVGVNSPAAGTSGAPPQGIDWTAPAPQLASSLSNYFKSKGVADSEVPYWVSKAPELVARGKELNDPEYANKRLAAANVFGGGASAPKAGTSAPSALGSYLSPSFAALQPTTPLPAPYQPGTIGAYVGRL